MHFYSGTEIDPKTITDISAYNRENGRMWKRYSIPYWLAGGFGLLSIWKIWFGALSGLCILLACTAGIWWLIREHKHIEKKYRVASGYSA